MLELSKTLSTKILESLRTEIEGERISAASHRSPRTKVPRIFPNKSGANRQMIGTEATLTTKSEKARAPLKQKI